MGFQGEKLSSPSFGDNVSASPGVLSSWWANSCHARVSDFPSLDVTGAAAATEVAEELYNST